MLKGLYHFLPTGENTLGFASGEELLYLGKHPKDKNWLRASNIYGVVGYVPTIYIELFHNDVNTLLNIIAATIPQSEHRGDITAIELIRLQDRLLNARNITEELIDLENEITRAINMAMPELDPSQVEMQKENAKNDCHVGTNTEIKINENGTSHSVKDDEDEESVDRPVTPVDEFACEMIDEVRHATGISHEKAQQACFTVINMIQREYGGIPPSVISSLEMKSPISRCPAIIERSLDTQKLIHLFKTLTACKDDEQQRSWAVHEDDQMIQDAVLDLNEILMSCDYSVSSYVMRQNGYDSVNSLALFFQMETRKEIRSGLTEVFLNICKIDPAALRELSYSILPMELAREFKDCAGDEVRLLTVARLLTFLLSTGEALPITHYDLLGTDFLVTVLKTIEDSPDRNSELANELTTLILAYNLQFYDPSLNLTIQALSEMRVVRYFSQALINHLNWGIDPIAKLPHRFNLKHMGEQQNSVFKLLNDIFSATITAKLFYVNDLQVLMDVLIRCIIDASPGDKKRILYLTLIGHIIRNTTFLELQHRQEELNEFFIKILNEEDPESSECQNIVKTLLLEFPGLKKKRGKNRHRRKVYSGAVSISASSDDTHTTLDFQLWKFPKKMN